MVRECLPRVPRTHFETARKRDSRPLSEPDVGIGTDDYPVFRRYLSGISRTMAGFMSQRKAPEERPRNFWHGSVSWFNAR
jgi:hypothetical protein